MVREAEGQKQAEKTVDGSGERHCDAVRSGKAVGGYGRTEGAREKDAGMRDEEKRRPENSRADGEMTFQVAGGRSKLGLGLAVLVEAHRAKTFVGMPVILGEIEIVLDERSAGKGVIADAIAAHPGIEKWERDEKEKYKQAHGITRAAQRP